MCHTYEPPAQEDDEELTSLSLTNYAIDRDVNSMDVTRSSEDEENFGESSQQWETKASSSR